MIIWIDKINQSMWSNRDGAIYELRSNFCTSNFKNPDEWTLMILIANKRYSNILNVKFQSKELLMEELKTSLAITWSKEVCTDQIVEENLRKQLCTKRCEHANWQRGCKIKDTTKLTILKMHFKEKLSINQISNALLISYSSVSRVISQFNRNPKNSNDWFESSVMKVSESWAIKQAIKNYVQNSSSIFNSNDIAKYVLQTFNVKIQKRCIIKFLKEDMNMSYRKASSRPSQASSRSNQIFKLLFYIEFANNLDTLDVLVNIDEAIFSRWTKFNYSWMEKGNQNISYNSNFAGSLALIGAITFYGDWFYSYLNSKNNTKNFIGFMKDLIDWLTIDLKIESRRIILIMDNSPIYTSKDWMNFSEIKTVRFYYFHLIVRNLLKLNWCFIFWNGDYEYNPNKKL